MTIESPDGGPACRQAGLVDALDSTYSSSFMYYTYAIKSVVKNYIYVGMTNDLERRLKQHSNGENRSTNAYKPFVLVLAEKYETRIDARRREKYLKSGVGKEYLKSLLK